MLAAVSGCAHPLMRGVEEDLPIPGPLECRVVVYRPSSRNAGHDYAVFDGETLIGFAQSGHRFEYRCSPGERLFYLFGRQDAAVRAILEAGRTYFLRAGERPDWFRLQLTLEARTPESAAEEVRDCVRHELDPRRAEAYRARRDPEVAARVAQFRANPADCGLLDFRQER